MRGRRRWQWQWQCPVRAAMKLQLIVVETGERWRRALLRMVLDPKSGHNDYGSFQSPGASPGLQQHAVDVPDSSSQRSNETRILVENSRITDMTQSDLYQRQPLLPPSSKTLSWSNGKVNGHSISEYYDPEESSEILKIHRSDGSGPNGIIKIDVPPPLREEPRFPKEKWKTFFAFIFLLFNFIFTTLSLSIVHEWVPDREKVPPLPDIFFKTFKQVDWALDVSEYIIVISTSMSTITLIFHKHRFIVLRRIFMILALLYMMRSITMFVTVLPMASTTYYCSPKADSLNALTVIKRVGQLISGFGLSINGKHTYCGDFIYSGHTVILTMCYLIISEYSPKRFFLIHWFQWIISVVGVVMVLLARGHYTVDVLIAYYVTTRVFWVYHTLANNAILKHHGPNNLLARSWWFRIFQYFERNVGGPVPRQYDWPLPWPRWCHGKHPNRNS